MIAKIKETGELIEVERKTSPNNIIYWWCKDKRLGYRTYDLIFFEVVTEEKSIDWEQRRYEIAKAVLASSFSTPMEGTSILSYVRSCVQIADILIAELKGGTE